MSKKGTKIPDECKSCQHLSTAGAKDNIHDRWCCAYGGGPSYKLIGHCRNTGYRERRTKETV